MIRTWTPADGFTRKPKPVINPTVIEKPKSAQPPKPKRPKPSALKRQRAYWLKQNQLSPQDYTIANQYLVKQIRTQTPMIFVGDLGAITCTIRRLWRYDIDSIIDGRKKRIHKLDQAMYHKAEDAPAVEKLLTHDPTQACGRLPKARSERYQVDDAVLLASLTDKTPLCFALRTGHTLTGMVRWFTAYDIGLTCGDGVSVHLFRHAVSDCHPQR